MNDTVETHLLLSSDFPPVHGGEAHYYFNQWRFAHPGHAVILASKEQGDVEFDQTFPIPVYRTELLAYEGFAGKLYKIAKMFVFTLWIAMKHQAAVIHCGQGLTGGTVGWLMKQLFGIRYFVYVHGAEELRDFQKFRFAGRFVRMPWIGNWFHTVCRDAEAVICASPWPREMLVKDGVDEHSIYVITPGVHPPDFNTLAGLADRLRKKYGLDGKKVILSTTRLSEHKGHDQVIAAMPAILARIPNAVFVIAGKGPDEERLKQLIREHRMEQYVVMAGFVTPEEKGALYSLCDVFVMLSRAIPEKGLVEGFGIVFLEAALFGKPVVGGRSGGIPEAVLDGHTGLLADPHDPAKIADAIMRVLSDPALAARLGRQGHERVRALMTAQSKARLWARLTGLKLAE